MPRLDDLSRLDRAHAWRVYRTARLLQRGLRQSLLSILGDRGVSLSPEQYFLLFRLTERDGWSQRELADPALDDRANITRQIDGLLKKGLVARAQDPDDRRRRAISLTPAGRALMDDLREDIVAERERLFGGVDDADLEAMIRVLDHLDGVLA